MDAWEVGLVSCRGKTKSMSLQPEIHLLGDRAWLIEWHGLCPDQALACMMRAISTFEQLPLHGQRELVPGFQSLTIHLQSPSSVDLNDEQLIRDRLVSFEPSVAELSRLLEIPVCYEPGLGWDIEELASQRGTDWESIAALHASVEYRVQCIGFSPGFPYLSGLPSSLITPRRSPPRLEVPRGAVAIGGEQTGIYTLDSPGGWNVIGRTPLDLFDPQSSVPSLLKMGDRVRFRCITRQQFDAWGEV